MDVIQWLAESNLLEMIVDKLSPSVSESSIQVLLFEPALHVSHMI
jgi:hypothetical protein